MNHLWETLLNITLTGRPRTPECCNVAMARPVRDWAMISAAAWVLLALLLGYDIVQYLSITEDVSTGVSIAAQGSVGPTAENIRKELSYFETLSTEHRALLGTMPRVSDPAK